MGRVERNGAPLRTLAASLIGLLWLGVAGPAAAQLPGLEDAAAPPDLLPGPDPPRVHFEE